MAKVTAWIATIIGVLLLLPLIGIGQLGTATTGISGWLIAIGVLVVGITKLIRSYSNKRR